MKEYKYKINGNVYKVAVGDIDNGSAQVEVNGTPYKVELDQTAAPVKVINAPRPVAAPRTSSGEKVIAKATSNLGAHKITSPLPGTVVQVVVKEGDVVKAADTVLILEAMKMENAIHAGRDGKIVSIEVKPGDSVLEGNVLMTLE